MAQDATGTPTSPDNIPKYNTATDSPSGRGFNAAMDAIQAALLARGPAPTSGGVKVWNAGTGTWDSPAGADGTKFLRDDGTFQNVTAPGWQTISEGSITATATFDIAVPQTYKDIRLTLKVRTGLANYIEDLHALFALDSGANYDMSHVLGNNSVLAHSGTDNQTSLFIGIATAANALADAYANIELEIPWYRDTDYRQTRSQYSAVTGQSGADQKRIGITGGVWQNATADALTAIRILGASGGSFVAGSKYVLEGRM